MAVSLDGRIAAHPDETDVARRALGFTNDDDREHLRQLLLTADAVVVGASSLKASGGAWALRNKAGAYPYWVVVTRSGLPADCRFLAQTELPRWLASPTPLPDAMVPKGVHNLVTGTSAPAAKICADLARAGAKRVILFGGSEVNRMFYEERLVDTAVLTLCPLILAASAAIPLVQAPLATPVKMTLVASQPKGNLVFLTYKVQKS